MDRECVCIGMLSGGVWDRVYECCRRVYSVRGISPTVTACGGGHQEKKVLDLNNCRVRKFTEKECFRLMGFDDESYEKAATVNSKTQLYKQAGNSIVVPVLEEIFRAMLPKKEGM